MVVRVIDLKVAFVFASISDRTAFKADSTGVWVSTAARYAAGSPKSSNIWITSISVRRLALPVKR